MTAVSKTGIQPEATYLGETIFNVPTNARKVLISITTEGNISGFFEMIRGNTIIISDFTGVAYAGAFWSANGEIGISYIANSRTAPINVVFNCKYV